MAFTRDLDNLIPIMTSNSAPSGYVASASSEYSASYPAYEAMNGALGSSDGWISTTTTGYLQIQFPSSKIVNKYVLWPYSTDTTFAPSTWTFKGSNNGTDWTTLDSQSSITGWASATSKTFTFSNATAYTYYRLDVTANCGGANLEIGELELCATGQYASLIPPMTSNTAPSGVASASGEYGEYWWAWKAFNGSHVDSYDGWITPNNVPTGWLSYEFITAKVVKQYSIVSRYEDPQTAPNTWTFEGWGGSAWEILDSQTGISGWLTLTARTFNIVNNKAYSNYIINITANNNFRFTSIG